MHNLTITALLGVLIFISGIFRLPAPVPGGEFQLSAPLAVLVCACFGFKRYLAAGILASLLGMLLGVHNIYSVVIQMVFRLTAGAVISAGRGSLTAIALSGPLGTLAARLVMWQLTGVSWQLLCAAALPGMIFTAALAAALYRPLQKLLRTAGTPCVLRRTEEITGITKKEC